MNCFGDRSSGSFAQLALASKTFESAEDFLQHGDLDRTACAILDMKLPGMNGLDLQQRLIARPSTDADRVRLGT